MQKMSKAQQLQYLAESIDKDEIAEFARRAAVKVKRKARREMVEFKTKGRKKKRFKQTVRISKWATD